MNHVDVGVLALHVPEPLLLSRVIEYLDIGRSVALWCGRHDGRERNDGHHSREPGDQ